MEYDKRFTQRVVLKDDALGEGLSYTSKAKQEVLTIRLGLYEDLGFSPTELADLLLESTILNADEMERIKLAKHRAHAFEKRGYYLYP